MIGKMQSALDTLIADGTQRKAFQSAIEIVSGRQRFELTSAKKIEGPAEAAE